MTMTTGTDDDDCDTLTYSFWIRTADISVLTWELRDAFLITCAAVKLVEVLINPGVLLYALW
jgi:hypothetical protein